MAQTVIGFFKDASEAQEAVRKLAEKGISQQQVDVSQGKHLDGTADLEGRNTNRVTDFFNKLFGHDSDDAKRYSTVGRENVTIVTVHASSEDLAEDAADVLDDCGAFDVDEHSARSTSGDRSMGSDLGSSRSGSDLDRGGLTGASGMDAGGRRRSRIINSSVDDEFRLRDR